MAHETGTASDPVDLLDKLRLFCIAQSITINEFRDEGTAPGKLLSVTFNGGYFSIGFEVNASLELEGYQMTQASGWNSSTAWGSQPNETTKTDASEVVRVNAIENGQPIGTYHFTFFTGGVVMVNILTNEGSWRHFCFGDIEKYGTFTGGAVILGHFVDQDIGFIDLPSAVDHLFFGMHPNTIFNNQRGGYIRVDDADTTIRFRKVASSGITPVADHMSATMDSGDQEFNRINGTSPSTTTQASSLHPIGFAVPIAVGSTKFSPIGVIRDVRFCNIQYLDNEQIFDTDWLAFSQGVKNDPDARPGTENTGYMGIVVKVQ